MSYADVAKKGPHQSAEEVSVSVPPPRLQHLFVCRVSSSRHNQALGWLHGLNLLTTFMILTCPTSRAPAIPEVERSDESVHSLIDVDSPHVSSVPSDFESQSVKTDTQAERIELEERAKQQAAKEKEAKEKAKEKAKRSSELAKKNADNPVILGNAVTVGILGTILGIGAYRKYAANELTWKVVGTWAGVVGLFALGDYYVSKYFFRKYPAKK